MWRNDPRERKRPSLQELTLNRRGRRRLNRPAALPLDHKTDLPKLNRSHQSDLYTLFLPPSFPPSAAYVTQEGIRVGLEEFQRVPLAGAGFHDTLQRYISFTSSPVKRLPDERRHDRHKEKQGKEGQMAAGTLAQRCPTLLEFLNFLTPVASNVFLARAPTRTGSPEVIAHFIDGGQQRSNYPSGFLREGRKARREVLPTRGHF